MKTSFYNESVWDWDERPTQTYPFPNQVTFKTDKWEFSIGILAMSGRSWEEIIMYRMKYFGYVQFRFLIFAVGWWGK